MDPPAAGTLPHTLQEERHSCAKRVRAHLSRPRPRARLIFFKHLRVLRVSTQFWASATTARSITHASSRRPVPKGRAREELARAGARADTSASAGGAPQDAPGGVAAHLEGDMRCFRGGSRSAAKRARGGRRQNASRGAGIPRALIRTPTFFFRKLIPPARRVTAPAAHDTTRHASHCTGTNSVIRSPSFMCNAIDSLHWTKSLSAEA